MDKNLGMGVMLGMLGSNQASVDALLAAKGKTISTLTYDDDALRFTFEDGSGMKLADEGQSCCEARYMRTDDDLSYFVGSKLMDAKVREGPDEEGEYGDMHEIAFLVVTTSKGTFTMANHNEHNGYYGGFLIRAESFTPVGG